MYQWPAMGISCVALSHIRILDAVNSARHAGIAAAPLVATFDFNDAVNNFRQQSSEQRTYTHTARSPRPKFSAENRKLPVPI